jgi:hypothetical protein
MMNQMMSVSVITATDPLAAVVDAAKIATYTIKNKN